MNRLEDIPGVGPKTLDCLKKVGINTIDDLICFYPRKYSIIMRSDMSKITDGDKVTIDGIVQSVPTIISIPKKRLKMIRFRISNDNNIYNICAFNIVYLCKELKALSKVTIIGKYDRMKNTIMANEVRMGLLPDEPVIEPKYHSISGISGKSINKFVFSVLDSDYEIVDYIPTNISNRYNFISKALSLRELHNPRDIAYYKRALQRSKYEELFMYLFKISYFKKKISSDENAISREYKKSDVTKFINSLPFKLTSDQLACIEDISNDLKSNRRMNRLLQGDVGSGKTIVAMISAYINYLSGYQTALMVPTEILANQHYEEALKLFKNISINICLLTSSINKKEKTLLYKKIKDGEVDLIIGTQSLIQEKLLYNNLGLIITDEQHRFGVNQRNDLKNKGTFPDILSMSATPIPRTYALTIYGDMDVSSIKTKPPGRKDVITEVIKKSDIKSLLVKIKEEVDLGHQVYVIAPMISDDDEESINNVNNLKEKFKIAFKNLYNIESVHGKLKPNDKNKIMKDFEDGKINILISTTVIEVGVNVPNASMIIIFNANLFGLSTLHQLRGRVGRSDIQSYCELVVPEVSERFKMLEKTNDGFEISEYDFLHRGEGDLFGVKQSGDAVLRLANIRKDYSLLLRVKEDVDAFISDNSNSEDCVKLSNYCDNIDLLN